MPVLGKVCLDLFENSKSRYGLLRWCSDKESTCQCKIFRFDPWIRKIPWNRKWQPAPVFLSENSMVRGAWQATVHGIAKSWTLLSDWAHTHKSCKQNCSSGLCCSVTQSRLTLCNLTDSNTPGFSVLHCLPELAQTHVLSVDDASQPSHPLDLILIKKVGLVSEVEF